MLYEPHNRNVAVRLAEKSHAMVQQVRSGIEK